jgi:hypothetical protein
MTTQRPKCKKILFIISGLTLFSVTVWKGLMLLDTEKLSGAEFVSLISIFAVISLLLSCVDQVQEFSIAGNIVKLKEVKQEANKAIDELKQARKTTFKFLLKLILKPSGFGDLFSDNRVDSFWPLYEEIKLFDHLNELSVDILPITERLIEGQLRVINAITQIKVNETIPPSPEHIEIKIAEMPALENNKNKENLRKALSEYSQVFNLCKELKASLLSK